MAGVTTAKKDHLSHEMGMHTEGCVGRTQQRFFDISEENVGYGYPDAPDVDFNKRAEIDCENLETKQINIQLRDLIQPGLRHHRAEESGLEALDRRRHSQPPEPLHRGLLRLLRLRPHSTARISASRAASAGPAARTCWPAPSSSRRTPARSSARRCAAATWSAKARSAHVPASTRRAATSSSAATPGPSPAS